MKRDQRTRLAAAGLVLVLSGCAPKAPVPVATTLQVTPTATDLWAALQSRTPIPFTTELPPSVPTPIDGQFAKVDLGWPEWWQCLRCADYRPGGGIWKLRFDRGIMRIYYGMIGWRSLASYTVAGDRLLLFNDPYCPDVTGAYHWHFEDRNGLPDRQLVLEVIDDSCSINLRGENLSAQPWENCGPPSAYTGASGHYHPGAGCEELDTDRLQADAPPIPAGLAVAVYPNWVKRFGTQPEILINSGPLESSPEGYRLSASEVSIPYGNNRVLWGFNDWVQLTVEPPANAIGVQIRGKQTMGWARVLFDGEEVWRGDSLKLGQEKDDFGGYIEVSGFGPGSHTLRIESLGVDYRPVTIAQFGVSLTGHAAP